MMVSSISTINPNPTNLTIMSFREWTLQNLEDTFHLHRHVSMPLLEEWLNMSCTIPPSIEKKLTTLQKELALHASHWNEAELKWNFISKIMDLVDFKTDKYSLFLERTVEAQVDNYLLRGYVDATIAKGRYEPKAPFFCFHEYKKEKGTADDPIGQLLSAMLAASTINQNNQPIYGAYVIGRMWFFIVLKDKDYAISDAFVASNSTHIKDIYRVLNNLKVIIDTKLL